MTYHLKYNMAAIFICNRGYLGDKVSKVINYHISHKVFKSHFSYNRKKTVLLLPNARDFPGERVCFHAVGCKDRNKDSNFRCEAVMGRTLRKRLRKKYSSRHCSIGPDNTFIDFMKWLVSNDWKPTCDHAPAVFPKTGRGLMARSAIKTGETIAKLPLNLLITVKTASNSGIGWLFNNDKAFSTQQVLATFIIWEKHLGLESFWHSYINLLPTLFSSPLFCSNEELTLFPQFIRRRVDAMRVKCDSMYEDLMDSFGQSICSHCNKPFSEIYTKGLFLWGFFIVNSRAVYLSPSHNSDHSVKLYDENCLALAPFLDLFNHSNVAKVQAYLLEADGTYCLKTLVPFSKYEEVFIHYGSHSNIKLFLEYGFILPSNANDTVTFEFSDILQAMSEVFRFDSECSKVKYKFLQCHDMLTGLYCNSEGISWNLKVVVYVLLCSINVDMKTIYQKAFSGNFSSQELMEIKKIGLQLILNKHVEYSLYLSKLKSETVNKINSETMLLAIELISILLKVLDQSKEAIEIKYVE